MSESRERPPRTEPHTVASIGAGATLRYDLELPVPPEQAIGRPDLADSRTDVYALGVILYVLLIRKHPHKLKGLSASELMASIAKNPVRRPTEFIPDFSQTWERVLLKALAKDPDSRYPSAVELGAALVKYAADEQ